MDGAKHYLGWYDPSNEQFEPDPIWRTVAVWLCVALIAVAVAEVL